MNKLDLQTHSWNGTHSHVGSLLYFDLSLEFSLTFQTLLSTLSTVAAGKEFSPAPLGLLLAERQKATGAEVWATVYLLMNRWRARNTEQGKQHPWLQRSLAKRCPMGATSYISVNSSLYHIICIS